MNDPVVLYSVQSYLAYYINTHFYNSVHYVWCASSFDSETNATLTPKLPYTSNPKHIYNSFKKDISTNDNHYIRSEIRRNTVGLLNGANVMLNKGKITNEQFALVKTIIKNCQKGNAVIEYFRPLIYVIPYELNKQIIRPVEVEKRALPLSNEYIIEELTEGKFDIIDIKEGGLR